MIRSLADCLEFVDLHPACRVAVISSEGKHFCAGANLSSGRDLAATTGQGESGHLYDEAVRIFMGKTPLVAAVHGAAVGGGLGLALAADFRIASPDARFSANFSTLGFHHGFGLTETLPRVVGQQSAWEMLYSGQRITAARALEIGLCDGIAQPNSLMSESRSFAAQLANVAPLALRSIRETMRSGLVDRIRQVTDREKSEQERLAKTDDFKEGVRASAERRLPRFTGR